MKILVISDSHGCERLLENILKAHRDCDTVIHLGDGSDDLDYFNEYTSGKAVCRVKGNCDMFIQGTDEIFGEFSGKRIFGCHGHRYNVKSGLSSLFYAAKEKNADIALYGHTHIQKLDENEDMIILNPGSVMKGNCAVIEINGEKAVVTLY